jgi:protein-disulfide isomerase
LRQGEILLGSDILIGASDKLFAMGTRPGVTFSLAPQGDSLATSPAYGEATRYALKNPQLFAYMNLRAFAPLLDREIARGAEEVFAQRNLEQQRALLGLLSSGSLSGVYKNDKTVVVRAVLTLAKEPLPASTVSDLPASVAVPAAAQAAAQPNSVAAADPYTNLPKARLADGGFVLGSPAAKVTLVEFGDYACPHCQDYEPTMQRFINEYVRTGKARYEYRTLPTAGGQTTAIMGNIHACLDQQRPGIFWLGRDQLYTLAQRGDYRAPDAPERFVMGLGLDYNKAVTCTATTKQVDTDKALAGRLGVNGTPAIMLRVGNGEPQFITLDGQTYDRGAVLYEVLAKAVDAAAQ